MNKFDNAHCTRYLFTRFSSLKKNNKTVTLGIISLICYDVGVLDLLTSYSTSNDVKERQSWGWGGGGGNEVML